jgi:hypothetical protein
VSAQEQISKLQGLLQRIQRNASSPRGHVPLPPPVAFAAPVLAPPEPAPFTAPAAYAAAPYAEPAPYAAPVPYAASVPYAEPGPASFDQSVDDLLGAAPAPSPLPADIDIPLDTVPPAAELSTSQAADADPFPLVASAHHAPPPPPIDEAFALESEVSEVRATIAPRDPAPEVTVAAIAAEAEPMAAEELSEDDLVEVTEGTPAPADVDIDFEDEDEQPPASSQRSKVASSMDEALAAAADHEAEREVPLQTPPPESGPQAAAMPSGIAAPAAPDVDALLGGELDIPTHAGSGMSGPTPEQLGQTIDLDEARGPSLELAEARGSDRAPTPVEELEVALPGPNQVGGYDESLQPPAEAREELEAHRRRLEDDIAPPPESLAQYPSVQPYAPEPEIVPIVQAALEAEPVGPEVVARPIPMGSPESFGNVRDSFRPSSFVELLDASLDLSGD